MNHERLRGIITIQTQLSEEFEFLLKELEDEIKDIFKPTYHYSNVEVIYGLKKIIIKVRTAHSFTYNNITQIADILTRNGLSINRLKRCAETTCTLSFASLIPVFSKC